MDRVVLDTDVSSLSLKHRLPSPVLTRLISKQPCITFVTLGELSQWAELRQWGRRNRDALENWLGGVIILPYSEDEPGRPMTRGSPHALSPRACHSRLSTPRTSRISPNTRAST
jgi:hypothetical protein